MKTLILSMAFLFSTQGFASNIHPAVEKEYLEMGGSQKALMHLKCFLTNYQDTDFNLKEAKLGDRCNGMAEEKRTVNMNNKDHAVIVDYTKKSSERRIFILDLKTLKKPYVEKFYAAHGKYKAKSYANTVKGMYQNTIEEIDYYSNVPNSMASSSGFYITGQIYQGRWKGPQGDKFSLILHGIGKDINDNACDRAIVLHGNTYINESGKNEGVKRMSAGCIMLDYDVVNQVIDQIRGGGGDHHKNEARLGGTVLLSYGNTEALLPSNYFCSAESQKSLRLK